MLPALRRQAVGVSFKRCGAAGAEQLDVRHLPENAPGRVLPAPDSQGSHPLCCQLHPKMERFGVWLASVPGLAVTPLLAWPSMPMGGSWRGAMVPPEPTPHSGGGLRLSDAVNGHSNHKSTWGDSVQLDTALSSDPFLTLF